MKPYSFDNNNLNQPTSKVDELTDLGYGSINDNIVIGDKPVGSPEGTYYSVNNENLPVAMKPSAYSAIEFSSEFHPLQKSVINQRAKQVRRNLSDNVANYFANNGINFENISAQLNNQMLIAKQMADESKADANKAQSEYDQANAVATNIEDYNNRISKREQEILLMKADAIDYSPYFNEMDRLTSMIGNAPPAPTPQKFELSETDNALVVLAGLLGGVEAMPQALQGVVAGAQARVDEYNKNAQAQFEVEQAQYNKQLSAQQNVVQTMSQRLKYAEANARDVYETKVKALQAMNLSDERSKKIALSRIKDMSQSYKDKYSKYTVPFTQKDIDDMNALRALLVRHNLVSSQAELDSLFPLRQVGEMTPSAVLARKQEAETKKSNAQVNLIAANIDKIQDDNARKAYATIDSLYDSLLKTWNTAGTLSQEQVTKLNNVMIARARSLGIQDGEYPLFVAGKTRQMLEDERRDVDRNAIIKIRRETLEKNNAYKELKRKMDDQIKKAKAKSTGGKVPAPINVAIGQGKAYVAVLTQKLKSDPNNKELQEKLEAAEAGLQAYLDWKNEIEKQSYEVIETGMSDKKTGDEVVIVLSPNNAPSGGIGNNQTPPPPGSRPDKKPDGKPPVKSNMTPQFGAGATTEQDSKPSMADAIRRGQGTIK